MSSKEILDLASADSFDEGDLLLVNKYGVEGIEANKKISYADFMGSMGCAAIHGYIATKDADHENKIVLNAINNAPIYKYYDGMKISFISPIQSNDNAQIRIGNLSYKHLFKPKSDTGVDLQQGDYIEAVLTGEYFRQVNDLKDSTNVYTNDYVVTAFEIAANNSSTAFTLKSAYGLSKEKYYNGMSILFTCPINTKGKIRVNIDSLGLKDISVPSNLNKEQIIWAIYDGEKFIYNKFSNDAPVVHVVSLPPVINAPKPIPVVVPKIVASTSTSPSPPPIIVYLPAPSPPQLINNETIDVGPEELTKTITDAINKLIELFGTNGRGKKYTILLKPNFIWSETVTIDQNQNLDWVTIKSKEEILVPIRERSFFGESYSLPTHSQFSLFISLGAIAPNLEVKILLKTTNGHFAQLHGGIIKLNNCSFRMEGSAAPCIITVMKGSKVFINNSVFNYKTKVWNCLIAPLSSTYNDPNMQPPYYNPPYVEVNIDNTQITALDAQTCLIDNSNDFFNLSVKNSQINWNVCEPAHMQDYVFHLASKTKFYNTSIHNSKGGVAKISRILQRNEIRQFSPCAIHAQTPLRDDYVLFENCTLSANWETNKVVLRIAYGDCRILGGTVKRICSNSKPPVSGGIYVGEYGRLIKNSSADITGGIHAVGVAGVMGIAGGSGFYYPVPINH